VNRVLDVDPEARTARVEPGVVMAMLQKAAAPHGLRFGPDPSTQARATLGGMIGNNACGPRAVAYGRTADNVLELDVVDGRGRRFTAGKGLEPVAGLDALVRAEMATLRTELGRFGRQVSGYSLEHLLPENGADLAKALVGTEGTVVTLLGATVRLVPVSAAPVLVVLGYPDGLAYGHFGDGCVHLRLDVPMERSGDPMRAFMTDAAHLVASHGGSLSGEHGDGRARSELLPVMYSEQAIAAFEGFKALLDPDDLLNPGVLVRPRPLDADLRRPHAKPIPAGHGGFAFGHDHGDFTTAVHRCVGVGKCRADTSAAGGFMCPSYLATRDEKDSTRGRARVLQEMANGSLVSRGWSSPEVHDVLDLCLSCKACSSDCPAGVDMAQYKAEVLHRTYRGRPRPVNHYALGWLPRWTRLVTGVPGLARLANAALSVRPLAKVVLKLGGMDTRRKMVAFAPAPFRSRVRRGEVE
jgi:ferredoxin